jgi:hypothetical protein
MTPDCIRLANVGSENRRLIHNALAPLGWKIVDSSIETAAPSTPEGPLEILIVEAPPIAGRPIATPLPTLWLLPPAAVVPQVAGEGPHDFIRLPAPCEVIVARCQALVRATLREKALRRYEREAIVQIERRRGVVAGIAHQVASPLSAVIEYLELLYESSPEDLGPRQRQFVTEAREATRHVADRIEEIIDATRQETGLAVEVSLARTELGPILEGIQEWALPRLRGKEQDLSIQVAPETPAVCGDAERIEQALRYLIESITSESPSGARIEIATTRDPEAAGFTKISVAAHAGAGEVGEHGAPFIGAEDEDRLDLVRMGAGLKLVRAIAVAQGGSVRVAEPSPRGPQIDLSIPAWGTRAARIAEGQVFLTTPGRVSGSSWVCRASGRQEIFSLGERPHWITLSRGEVLAICADPPEGIEKLGRVRDLREPGALGLALQPILEVRPIIEEQPREDEACKG